MAYAGEIARAACARRTRDEILSYRPPRPLPYRDELRLKVMLARCELCNACASLIATIDAMLPPEDADEDAPVIPLRGASRMSA